MDQAKKIDAVAKTIRWAVEEITADLGGGKLVAEDEHTIRSAAMTIVMTLDLIAEAGA